jgi:hypothetical protein
MTLIRLRKLAKVIGLDVRTAQRWASDGIIRGRNLGRGRGNGVVLNREQAVEACAVMLLRRAGISMQRIRGVVREMQHEGRTGNDFLAVGAAGRVLLLDGAGEAFPLRDPKTRQTFLPFVFDLRRMRDGIEHVLDELEREVTEKRRHAT